MFSISREENEPQEEFLTVLKLVCFLLHFLSAKYWFWVSPSNVQPFGLIFILEFTSVNFVLFSPSGAVRLQTPLLLPRNRKLYEGCEMACFMDHSGMLVTLPYDLRVSAPGSAVTIHLNLHGAETDPSSVLTWYFSLQFPTPGKKYGITPLGGCSFQHFLKKFLNFVAKKKNQICQTV